MKARNLATALAWLVALGAVAAVLVQRSQIAALRTDSAQTPGPRTDASTGAQGETPSVQDTDAESRELLQLRSEVTRLTARKRELADVGRESESLQAQLAATATNAGGLPVPSYVRRSQARFLGYGTPQNTLQSWLWALQNRDFEKILQAFSPDESKALQTGIRSEEDLEKFFKGAGAIPGLGILNTQTKPDGTTELQVYVAPQIPPQTIQLQLVNGEWKMSRF